MTKLIQNNCERLYHDSLSRLITLAENEDMKPLSVTAIRNHAIGFGLLRGGEVLAYAGITGPEEFNNAKLAVIGGVITHPSARKQGLALLTLNELITVASTPPYAEIIGHEGYAVRCNSLSAPLFAKLGFYAISHTSTRTTMSKLLPIPTSA